MWSTCVFTTITSQEKLKRLQSWRQDGAVQPHTAVWSVMKMSSCPAMLIPAEEVALPAPRSRTRQECLGVATAGRAALCPAPLSGVSMWAARTERLPFNQERGGRKSKVGARCAPAASPAAAHVLLHCSSSQARVTGCQEPLQMVTIGWEAGEGGWPQISATESRHCLQSYAATPPRVSTCWMPTEETLSCLDFFFPVSSPFRLLLLSCEKLQWIIYFHASWVTFLPFSLSQPYAVSATDSKMQGHAFLSYNRVFRIIHDLEMHSLICTALQPGLCLLMPCSLFFIVAQAGKETKRSLQTPQFCL